MAYKKELLQAKAGTERELFCFPTSEIEGHGWVYPLAAIRPLCCQFQLSLDIFTLAGETPCYW